MKRCALSMAIILAVGLIMTGNVYSLSSPWATRVHGDDHPWGGDQINDGGPTEMSADPPDYFVTGFTAIDFFFNQYWLRLMESQYYSNYKTTFIPVATVKEKNSTDEPLLQQRNTNGSKGN